MAAGFSAQSTLLAVAVLLLLIYGIANSGPRGKALLTAAVPAALRNSGGASDPGGELQVMPELRRVAAALEGGDDALPISRSGGASAIAADVREFAALAGRVIAEGAADWGAAGSGGSAGSAGSAGHGAGSGALPALEELSRRRGAIADALQALLLEPFAAEPMDDAVEGLVRGFLRASGALMRAAWRAAGRPRGYGAHGARGFPTPWNEGLGSLGAARAEGEAYRVATC